MRNALLITSIHLLVITLVIFVGLHLRLQGQVVQLQKEVSSIKYLIGDMNDEFYELYLRQPEWYDDGADYESELYHCAD
jgi:hypothetical protein